jgi:hypothetical protein
MLEDILFVIEKCSSAQTRSTFLRSVFRSSHIQLASLHRFAMHPRCQWIEAFQTLRYCGIAEIFVLGMGMSPISPCLPDPDSNTLHVKALFWNTFTIWLAYSKPWLSFSLPKFWRCITRHFPVAVVKNSSRTPLRYLDTKVNQTIVTGLPPKWYSKA